MLCPAAAAIYALQRRLAVVDDADDALDTPESFVAGVIHDVAQF